ncbi:claudin-10 [Maylandia zebra]|uniref:Claudin 10d n=4 Tax=Haplochromini TaxID=319058 RepID=A0A3Q2VYB7_HAPBU|nr:claudin-10-like [Maylandia zebra]XP_005744289.1 PREDICTED: claudin-10-like [Pundamilia nyererei]XP_005948624.1 claudin-10 [Haplochromis burtoni]XP_026015527.1 claudin-10-like [Astatotilapia calliptera]XP_039870811.1 claudin-10 [Simochromis diagramma]
MKYRTVVMYVEIGCFVSCLCGWILVSSTLPTEYWTFSEVGTVVLTTSNYYSNLWMDCISDTTGVSDCKYYPSMLALPVFLHACRALAVCAVITGFFGGVLTLIGMKCTKIGGTEIVNSRVTFSGAITYLASGGCGMITYSWWANRVITEFKNPNFRSQKFELGAAIFVGWGGSLLLICAGAVLAYLSGKEILPSCISSTQRPQRPVSYTTARTRRTYMMPPPSSRVTLVPPLYNKGMDGRTTRATNKTDQTLGRDSFV